MDLAGYLTYNRGGNGGGLRGQDGEGDPTLPTGGSQVSDGSGGIGF